MRSGSLRLKRVISLKSRADQGHSEVADTQGQSIPADGNEPNLIFDGKNLITKYAVRTCFIEKLSDSLIYWVGFQAISASCITVSPESYLVYSFFVCL